jgi:hypothetical protein
MPGAEVIPVGAATLNAALPHKSSTPKSPLITRVSTTRPSLPTSPSSTHPPKRLSVGYPTDPTPSDVRPAVPSVALLSSSLCTSAVEGPSVSNSSLAGRDKNPRRSERLVKRHHNLQRSTWKMLCMRNLRPSGRGALLGEVDRLQGHKGQHSGAKIPSGRRRIPSPVRLRRQVQGVAIRNSVRSKIFPSVQGKFSSKFLLVFFFHHI